METLTSFKIWVLSTASSLLLAAGFYATSVATMFAAGLHLAAHYIGAFFGILSNFSFTTVFVNWWWAIAPFPLNIFMAVFGLYVMFCSCVGAFGGIRLGWKVIRRYTLALATKWQVRRSWDRAVSFSKNAVGRNYTAFVLGAIAGTLACRRWVKKMESQDTPENKQALASRDGRELESQRSIGGMMWLLQKLLELSIAWAALATFFLGSPQPRALKELVSSALTLIRLRPDRSCNPDTLEFCCSRKGEKGWMVFLSGCDCRCHNTPDRHPGLGFVYGGTNGIPETTEMDRHAEEVLETVEVLQPVLDVALDVEDVSWIRRAWRFIIWIRNYLVERFASLFNSAAAVWMVWFVVGFVSSGVVYWYWPSLVRGYNSRKEGDYLDSDFVFVVPDRNHSTDPVATTAPHVKGKPKHIPGVDYIDPRTGKGYKVVIQESARKNAWHLVPQPELAFSEIAEKYQIEPMIWFLNLFQVLWRNGIVPVKADITAQILAVTEGAEWLKLALEDGHFDPLFKAPQDKKQYIWAAMLKGANAKLGIKMEDLPKDITELGSLGNQDIIWGQVLETRRKASNKGKGRGKKKNHDEMNEYYREEYLKEKALERERRRLEDQQIEDELLDAMYGDYESRLRRRTQESSSTAHVYESAMEEGFDPSDACWEQPIITPSQVRELETKSRVVLKVKECPLCKGEHTVARCPKNERKNWKYASQAHVSLHAPLKHEDKVVVYVVDHGFIYDNDHVYVNFKEKALKSRHQEGRIDGNPMIDVGTALGGVVPCYDRNEEFENTAHTVTNYHLATHHGMVEGLHTRVTKLTAEGTPEHTKANFVLAWKDQNTPAVWVADDIVAYRKTDASFSSAKVCEPDFLPKVGDQILVCGYREGKPVVAPGVITAIDPTPAPPATCRKVYYTCDTDGGMSGSAIRHVETNRVIGIHQERGEPGRSNIGRLYSEEIIKFLKAPIVKIKKSVPTKSGN